MTFYREKYLRSRHWRELRADILAKRPNCQNCGLSRILCQFFYFSDLDLHHLTYARLWRELPEDVQVLCRACHEIAEIPKHWPEYVTFKGTPDFLMDCPDCGYQVFLSIPYDKVRSDDIGPPVYVPGRPEAGGCQCEIEDVGSFIVEHFNELSAQR